MRTCFVGNDANGAFALFSFIQKYNKNNSKPMELSTVRIEEDDSNLVENLIAQAFDIYVFDISSFKMSEEETVRTIQKVKDATNCTVIIYAPGYLPESRLLNSFRAIGINKLLTEERNLGNIQARLQELIETEDTEDVIKQETLIEHREDLFEQLINDNPVLTKVDKYIDQTDEEVTINEVNEDSFSLPIKPPGKGTMRIGVVGSKRGIGTTTAAIQFVKYLNSCEPGSSAYLEYNKTGYIDNLLNTYVLDDEDAGLERYVFKGVELYKDPKKLSALPKYDYMIYDYGSVEDIIELSSLYEKDLIILVGGAKPNANEMGKMTMAMKMVYDQKNVFYLFNFIHPQEQEDVLQVQGELANRTYFIKYAPSPFILNHDHISLFHDILTQPLEIHNETKKRKKLLQRVFPKGRE